MVTVMDFLEQQMIVSMMTLLKSIKAGFIFTLKFICPSLNLLFEVFSSYQTDPNTANQPTHTPCLQTLKSAPSIDTYSFYD